MVREVGKQSVTFKNCIKDFKFQKIIKYKILGVLRTASEARCQDHSRCSALALNRGLRLRSIGSSNQEAQQAIYQDPELGEYGHQSVMGLGVDGGGDVEVRVKQVSWRRQGERVTEEM